MRTNQPELGLTFQGRRLISVLTWCGGGNMAGVTVRSLKSRSEEAGSLVGGWEAR